MSVRAEKKNVTGHLELELQMIVNHHNFAPEFELLARMVKGKVKAGKVDCQAYPQTCQKAGIRAYPSVKLYHYERAKKSIWEEQINSRDAKTIAALIYGKLETPP